MKRQRIKHEKSPYTELNDSDFHIPLQTKTKNVQTIEACVLEGDTLQAISLRFNCTIAELKRLNKIDKDNEIFARKVVRIPLTAHNILLDTLPPQQPVPVHKSGTNSPKNFNPETDPSTSNSIIHNTNRKLDEKLIVAAVNSATINNIILNSKIVKPEGIPDTSLDVHSRLNDENQALLEDSTDDIVNFVQPRLRRNDFSWSGSDCDMSWICLFIFILALCFIIPLIYVFIIYEAKHERDNSTTHHLNGSTL